MYLQTFNITIEVLCSSNLVMNNAIINKQNSQSSSSHQAPAKKLLFIVNEWKNIN